MNAYNTYGCRNITTKRKTSVFNTFFRLLRAVFAVICERITAVEIRTACIVAGFAVALGVIGGMESGVLPLYIGLPVCLVLSAAGLLTHFED